MPVLNKMTQDQRTQALRSDMNLRGMASGMRRGSWIGEVEWEGGQNVLATSAGRLDPRDPLSFSTPSMLD